ncbi:hypothetical protein [Pantoea alhagi]|uniref:hypothetical protein n=1 Tax=Pantoea alhagi TaxID=1891675 RepID=UPI0012F4E90F|nr:hypothetical protein [Pantoea alhagi]
MNLITKLGLIAVLTSTCHFANALSLKGYLDAKKDTSPVDQKVIADLYLGAVAQSLIESNAVVYNQLGKNLFCMPNHIVFGSDELDAAIEKYIGPNPLPENLYDVGIAAVGLISLERMYPCQ